MLFRSLKAGQIGQGCAGTGFVAALIALAAGGPPVLALHILFGAFALGSLAEGCISVYLHERGVGHE